MAERTVKYARELMGVGKKRDLSTLKKKSTEKSILSIYRDIRVKRVKMIIHINSNNTILC
ncbi:hypothetical protein KDA_74530 [Dictyobacter alpinus]|uniref:Uncharacterized protein n=1 Tax=Dictyobacter alpinus TaxID=2014873 RepID=A0A402BD14_9CHLR|nr:hypothetical protein KDA_00010 [Dictyobacter alpinus]GCE29177.1 hypothetical protein KDA_46610 [Dictyobacter alpinus]GCE29178.1 hypothetical protein KDA_46620 [Dictyobacter alpinus]GCE31969.1 hypothetical protein KDA_74530 [Dictyobacter alpinus]